MKKICKIKMLTILLISITLSGCQKTAETTQSQLNENGWEIAAEQEEAKPTDSLVICMNDQGNYDLDQAVLGFQKENPDINIEVITLLNVIDEQTEQDRAAQIKQIQTEVMSGKGPDLFLLDIDKGSLLPKLFMDLEKSVYAGWQF